MDQTLRVRLQAEASQFRAQLAAASAETRRFGKDVADHTSKGDKAFRDMSHGAMLAGGAMVAGFGLAIGAAAKFEKSMSAVKAVADASKGELSELSKAAIKAGADTSFSATESAKAEEELAKAGVSVKDILGGGLRGALSLAAAGQLGLGEAATIAANAMNQFHLTGADTGHIADVLAAGANKSAADVSTLGQALQQVGLVANQTGLTFEQTTGILGLFAQNGLQGSDAGTSLKTALLRLNPSSKEAADLMKQLGINFYDAQGQFVGIENVAQVLQDRLGGLSQQQRNTALQTIFGADAIRGATLLYTAGADGVRKWTNDVNDQGAATRVAGTQMNNLSGDIEALKGSIETVLIQSGSSATSVLRGLAKGATDVVNQFGSLPSGVQTGVGAFIGLSGAVIGAAGAIGTVAPKIRGVREELVQLGRGGEIANAGIGLVGKGLAGLAAFALAAEGANLLTDAFTRLRHDSAPSSGAIAKSLTELRHEAGATFKASGALADDFGSHLEHLGRQVELAGGRFNKGPLVGVQGGLFGEHLKNAKKIVGDLDNELAQLVQGGHAEQAAAQFKIFSEQAHNQGASTKEIRKSFDGYLDAVDKAAAENNKLRQSLDQLPPSQRAAAQAAQANGASLQEQADAARQAQEAAEKLGEAFGKFVSPFAAFDEAQKQTQANMESNAEAQQKAQKKSTDAAVNAAKLQDHAMGKSRAEIAAHSKAIRDAADANKASFSDEAVAASTSLDSVLRVLQGKQEKLAQFQNNVLVLARQGYTSTSQALLDQFQEDPDQAVTFANKLLSGTDEQRRQFEEAFKKTGYDAVTGMATNMIAAVGLITNAGNIVGSGFAFALEQSLRLGLVKGQDVVGIDNPQKMQAFKPAYEEAGRALGTQAANSLAIGVASGQITVAGIAKDDYPGQLRAASGAFQQVGSQLGTGFRDQLVNDVASGKATLSSQAQGYVQILNNATNQVLLITPTGAVQGVRINGGNALEHQPAGRRNAAGAIDGPHVAQFARGGDWRVWAEPETKGEAYIPLANDWRRPRAKAIASETVSRLGGVAMFAAGGIPDAPGVPGSLGGAWGDAQHEVMTRWHDAVQAGYDSKGKQLEQQRAAAAFAASAPGNVSGAVALGQQMAAARGWTGGEWNALYQLWQGESGWNPNAVNSSSGAAGIPQALGHGHVFNLGDAGAQIQWGLNYIAGRYGSPSRAYAAWLSRSPHWYGAGGINTGIYDRGGVLQPGLTLAYNGTGRPEKVTSYADGGITGGIDWGAVAALSGGAAGPDLAQQLQDIADQLKQIQANKFTSAFDSQTLTQQITTLRYLQASTREWTDEWFKLGNQANDALKKIAANRQAIRDIEEGASTAAEQLRRIDFEWAAMADHDSDRAVELVKQRRAITDEIAENQRSARFDALSTQQKIADLRRREDAETKFSDKWTELHKQRVDLEKQEADAVKARTDELVGSMSPTRWEDVQQGAPASELIANLTDQNGFLLEWANGLTELEKRGLSREAAAMLGLNDPSSLGQVRELLAASPAELKSISTLVSSRQTSATGMAGREHAGRPLVETAAPATTRVVGSATPVSGSTVTLNAPFQAGAVVINGSDLDRRELQAAVQEGVAGALTGVSRQIRQLTGAR